MTTNEDQNTGQLPSKISRRTLAAGAAWSVPVIAVASAAPAYAVSGVDCLDLVFSADSCKKTNPPTTQCAQGFQCFYKFKLCITNDCASPQSLTYTMIKTNSGQIIYSGAAVTVTVPANGQTCIDNSGGFWEVCLSNCAGKIQLFNGATQLLETHAAPSGTCS